MEILSQYGLSTRKRPLPAETVDDRLGLAFWVVAYWRLDVVTVIPSVMNLELTRI